MYDTVSAVLREPPSWVRDPSLWNRERSSIDTATGEIHRTRMMNTAHGLLLTLHDGGALQAERSLPKALRGQNIEDLTQGEVSDALAVVDGEIRDALGDGLPEFSRWLPCRVDYCQNVRLRDEAAVLRSLDKLASVELPYKGLPVRGQHHSVAWPKGAVRPKVYGKYLETKGDPRAVGVMRFESGVYKARSFRSLLGEPLAPAPMTRQSPLAIELPPLPLAERRISASVAEWSIPKTPAALTVAGVLTPELHAVVLGRYVEYLRGDLMSKDEISDLEFMRELVACLGFRRAAGVVGWCGLYYAYGVRSRADLMSSDIGHLATRYRVLGDVRAFRDHLRAKGLVLVDDGDAAGVDELILKLAAQARAA